VIPKVGESRHFKETLFQGKQQITWTSQQRRQHKNWENQVVHQVCFLGRFSLMDGFSQLFFFSCLVPYQVAESVSHVVEGGQPMIGPNWDLVVYLYPSSWLVLPQFFINHTRIHPLSTKRAPQACFSCLVVHLSLLTFSSSLFRLCICIISGLSRNWD